VACSNGGRVCPGPCSTRERPGIPLDSKGFSGRWFS
jgi:hypothetical protein